ncbi:MAG: nucleotidyltransferase domain-containing protein [Chloroflexota bacterium]
MISPEEMAVYRETARRRAADTKTRQIQRRQQAWAVARQAVVLLKEQFGVDQVAVFGSLARGDLLHAHSDVDLAVWGMDERLLYRAVSRLLDIDPTFLVDLVRVEEASDRLRAAIERDGVIL